VERTLRSWNCRDFIDAARVVVTELVSNVVRHAGTDVCIEVELLDDRLRIAVADHAEGELVLRTVNPRNLGGRGLHLVDELSERWGVDRHPGEKSVWAEWRVAVPAGGGAPA
jgi:anti-sigma regulatory factor (Ser/Thr protein kinase)